VDYHPYSSDMREKPQLPKTRNVLEADKKDPK